MISKDRRVPRVPDKKTEKYTPIKKQEIVIILPLILEFLQLAKQKSDTPNRAKENGIGLPENKYNLQV